MSEFIEVISKQSLDQLDQLIKKLNIATGEVKEFNNISKQIKVPSEANEQIKKTTRSTQKLSEAQKEAQRLSRALERQKERLAQATSEENKELLRLRYQTQQTNREQKQAEIISKKLGNAYQRLQAEVNQTADRYRDLATKQERGVRLSREEERELKDVTRQLERKQRALKNVDAKMGVYNRNVGNYKSAWKGVGGILKASIAAFGVFSAIDITREIFRQVKAIDALNLALSKVTETTEEYNQTMGFLQDLSERSGNSIDILQKAYIKFQASARTTNLTLEQTQDIFDKVILSMSTLGASSAEVEGALRALEQMLSKGKVQAEEIRGQLGERLPGAFQILAKSMGLTTQELSKQLELGNVISEEVLPKFAEELAKTFGVDNQTRIETITAEQGRLSTAWSNFIRNIESGGNILGRTFKFILSATSGLLDAIGSLTGEAPAQITELYKKSFEETKGVIDDAVKYVKSQTELNQFVFSLQFEAEQAKRDAEQEIKEINARLEQTNSFPANIANAEERTQLKDRLEQIRRDIVGFNAQLDAVNVFFNPDDKTVTEDAKKTGERIALAIQEGLKSAEVQGLNILGESLDTWEKEQAIEIIQWFRDLPKEVLNGTNELDQWANKVTEATLKLRKLAQAQKESRDIFREQFASLGQMLNIDTSILIDAFETLENQTLSFKESIATIAPAVGEIFSGIGQTILQNEQIRLQNQLALNSEYYNNLIQQASGNAEQQELLRREQAQKERQIRQKQAENEKQGALFDIAISTAVGIIKALAMTPPNVPLSIAIGAIGAAKAALVSSRPVPQFKKGRKGGPETWAILGDGYKNEPIIDKKGNLKAISPNKPTMMHLDKGDSVLPNMDLLSDQILLANVQASANKMTENNQNKGLERMLAMQSSNIERSIIKSLKKANFVNVNNTKVDLGFEFRKQKYKGQ